MPKYISQLHTAITQRYRNALEALQSQSAAATSMLEQKMAKKVQDRAALSQAQAAMKQFETEVQSIWAFVRSGRTRKTIPELTMTDLEPLIENAAAEQTAAEEEPEEERPTLPATTPLPKKVRR